MMIYKFSSNFIQKLAISFPKFSKYFRNVYGYFMYNILEQSQNNTPFSISRLQLRHIAKQKTIATHMLLSPQPLQTLSIS